VEDPNDKSKASDAGELEPVKAQDEGQLIAEAMAHPTRVRILMSMSTPPRVLSPSVFSLEEAMPLDHCSYHFKQLEKLGCIALVDTQQRRGATEHLYEQRQLALVWTSVWRTLSPQTKRAILESVMGGGVRALGRAIDNGTFEARDESHLSWNTLEIDEKGWRELSGLLDVALAELQELKADCIARIDAGGDHFLASYFLVTFESPAVGGSEEGPLMVPPPATDSGLRPTENPGRKKRRAAREGQTEQQIMASMMRHPIRVQALMAMNTPRRRLSPKQFACETGLPVGTCAYHFGELEDTACIELVGVIQRRGATEHFYEPRKTALQWTEDWKNLGPAVKQTFLASVARGALRAVGKAIADGTFEAREDSYFAWSTMKVDLPGWVALTEILDRALVEMMRVTDESWARVLAGATPFTASYFVSAFESPDPDLPVL
jgi:hypothetical protein